MQDDDKDIPIEKKEETEKAKEDKPVYNALTGLPEEIKQEIQLTAIDKEYCDLLLMPYDDMLSIKKRLPVSGDSAGAIQWDEYYARAVIEEKARRKLFAEVSCYVRNFKRDAVGREAVEMLKQFIPSWEIDESFFMQTPLTEEILDENAKRIEQYRRKHDFTVHKFKRTGELLVTAMTDAMLLGQEGLEVPVTYTVKYRYVKKQEEE